MCWLNMNGLAIPLNLQLLITVLIMAVILGQDILPITQIQYKAI